MTSKRPNRRIFRNTRAWVGSIVLIALVFAAGAGLAAWKDSEIRETDALAASMPEPMELVTAAAAKKREHRATTTAIGTVLALRSVTLRNELPGTVRYVRLTPGQIVDAGAVLVALDVSVEEADLAAHEAQATLAETVLLRAQRLSEQQAISREEVDRAQAERDIAVAQIARTKAIIERKTIRAPFRARIGIADVHPGQFLDTGTEITTLQGVDDALHVDFAVAQRVAEGLRQGERLEVFTTDSEISVAAKIVAIDARVDPSTRNATVRARIDNGNHAPAPGASVRVEVPVGMPQSAVVVPVSALRRGPSGDHVFVIGSDEQGQPRAQMRPVRSGPMLGAEVAILDGLSIGEQVAASGSFKLYEGTLLAIADEAASGAGAE